MHLDRRLTFRRRREDLRLAGWNSCVSLDQFGKDPAERLDAQAEWCHVKEQQVFDLSREHAGLDCGADCNHFLGVDAFVRFLAEELLHHFLNPGYAGRAADKNDLVDLTALYTRITHSAAARLERSLQNVVDKRFELGSRQLHL